MTTQPSAILLDVGGVFLLPSRSHIRSALQLVGHSVAEDSTIDRAHYQAVRAFPMDLEAGEYMGPYWTEYLEVYARAVGVGEDLLEEAVEHLRNEYVTGWLWSHLIEGSKDGLAALAATGVPVGVVSNSDGTIERRLAEMALLQVGPGAGVEVRCVIDSGTVGVEKPDPRIFELALDRLVSHFDYPTAVRRAEFRPHFPHRGVIVDREAGVVLKMDRHRYVGRAYLGREQLDGTARGKLYRQERLDLRSERFYWVDTLFELPEVNLLAELVELQRRKLLEPLLSAHFVEFLFRHGGHRAIAGQLPLRFCHLQPRVWPCRPCCWW